jgi:hypothetical protein
MRALENLIKVIFTDDKLSRMDGAMSEIKSIFQRRDQHLSGDSPLGKGKDKVKLVSFPWRL